MIQNGDSDGIYTLIQKHPELIEIDLMKERRANITPLSVAVGLGNKSAWEVLLAAGANVNEQDKFGNSPLHKATRIGDTNLIFLLIQNGADLSLKDAQGKTAFDFAKEMIAMLIHKTC